MQRGQEVLVVSCDIYFTLYFTLVQNKDDFLLSKMLLGCIVPFPIIMCCISFNSVETEAKPEPVKPKGILKNSLVTAAYSSDEDSEDETTPNNSDKPSTSASAGSSLPSGKHTQLSSPPLPCDSYSGVSCIY